MFEIVDECGREYCGIHLEDASEHQYSPANEADRALAGRWPGAVHGTPPLANLDMLPPDSGPGHCAHLLRPARAALTPRFDNRGIRSVALPDGSPGMAARTAAAEHAATSENIASQPGNKTYVQRGHI